MVSLKKITKIDNLLIRKKVSQSNYSLSFFHLEYFLLAFLVKVLENFISNKISLKNFQSEIIDFLWLESATKLWLFLALE